MLSLCSGDDAWCDWSSVVSYSTREWQHAVSVRDIQVHIGYDMVRYEITSPLA